MGFYGLARTARTSKENRGFLYADDEVILFTDSGSMTLSPLSMIRLSPLDRVRSVNLLQ